MSTCRAVSTPLPPGSRLVDDASSQMEAEREEMKDIPYRRVIGSLMYLATCTRPDIPAAVSSLARFNADPGMAHWEGVLHVLKYM